MTHSLLSTPVGTESRHGLAEYRFDCPDLPDAFYVTGFEAVEALNEPYRASIRLRAEHEATDCHELLGRDIALFITVGPSERVLRGIVDRVAMGEDLHRRPTCTVSVVPALFALSRTRNTRIFQEKTALEIVVQVLTESLAPYGRSFQATGVDSSRLVVRNYCVQYRETSLAFVHRLLEEEGIGYYFDHEAEPEVLVLFDANRGLARCAPVHFGASTDATGWDRLSWFPGTSQRTATKLTTRDYDWRRGGRGQLEASGPVAVDSRRTHEVYEHGAGDHHVIHEDTSMLLGMAETLVTSLVAAHMPMAVADRAFDLKGSVFDGFSSSNTADRGRVRSEWHKRDARTFEGISTITALSAGSAFELSGHPTAGADGEYYVTRIMHSNAPSPNDGPDQLRQLNYHNRIHCLPLAAAWRPDAVTPKPRIDGTQTATVTGPPGLDVYTDPHGRIKVRFPWDRAETDLSGHYTCWLRVAQAWAGATSPAFLFIPRVGMEVLVTFLDGDPDRPLVTGCVYNGDNPTPALLPPQATKSIIRTRSVPQGIGYNELSFEDALGMERVYIRAERDFSELVQNHHDVRVHRDERISIGGSQSEHVGKDQNVQVGRHVKRSTGGNSTEATMGSSMRTVRGTVQDHVGRSYALDAGGAVSTRAGGEWRAQGTRATMIAGSSTLRMSDEESGKDHEDEKGMTLRSFGSVIHVTENKIELKVGDSSIVITPDHVQVNGKTLPLEK